MTALSLPFCSLTLRRLLAFRYGYGYVEKQKQFDPNDPDLNLKSVVSWLYNAQEVVICCHSCGVGKRFHDHWLRPPYIIIAHLRRKTIPQKG
jgi:hypothetical protein